MELMQLPNGSEIYYLDKVTALYIYNEIYEDDVYFQHGISLEDGDTVFDVGANIGVFSRYVAEKFSNAKIYTFEPVQQIFEVLEANLSDYKENIINYNMGLSDLSGSAEFYYYPNCSGDSTRTPFDWERKVQGYLDNYKDTICVSHPIAKIVPPFLRRFIVERGLQQYYKSEKVECHLSTMSDVIKANSISRIDLLKVDAENAEREVLGGIDERDWDIIRQVTMEVHEHIRGGENLSREIVALLESKGFTCTIDKSDVRSNMGVFMLYGKR